MNTIDLKAKEQPGNATVSYTSKYTFNQRLQNEPLKVLTEEQWAFWKLNGYVVVSEAVPQVQLDNMCAFIWEFEEKDPQDESTWYLDKQTKREIKMTELKGTGMVEAYNHQKQWDNRMYPKVHQIFSDIWGREDLWVSIDRANLNMPIRPGQEYKAFIHWDIDTSLTPPPVNVQGVLALNDQTDINMGGFQCIPGLYQNFAEWVKTQPQDRDPFKPDTSGLEVVKVPMKAGDLLIWDSMLAHGIRVNNSDKPRLAQYIAMTPAQPENEELRQWRISSWRDRITPEGYPFPGDPRNWEQTKYNTAELSELGEQLLGLKPWA